MGDVEKVVRAYIDALVAGRAHLTREMAAALIPLLEQFVATGSIAILKGTDHA